MTKINLDFLRTQHNRMIGPNFLKNIESFKSFHIVAVSALGSEPFENQMFAEISPKRVLDPFFLTFQDMRKTLVFRR